jgi:peptidoglycan hydrolase CwlO-like protein
VDATDLKDLERKVADAIRKLHNAQDDLRKIQNGMNELRSKEGRLISMVDQEQRNVDAAIELLQVERRAVR